MTMKETQANLIRDTLILKELQHGNFPSVSLIEEQLQRVMENQIAGRPLFTYIEMVKGKASDSVAYNNMFGNMSRDLEVSFEATKNLNNRIMALASYYESSRTGIDRELKRIERNAEILHQRSLSHVNRDVVSDTLSDFSMIEFKANNARNIRKTNALVDLRHGEVYLDKAQEQTKKYDLSSAKVGFKATTEHAILSHISSPINALNDNTENGWRTKIVVDQPGGAAGQLDVLLPEAVYATSVSIDMQVGKPLSCTLLLSKDGESFTEYETRVVTTTYQWVFEKQQVGQIRVLVTKTVEDERAGNDYIYMFGAKSISLLNEEYMKEGYLVSLPHVIHHHEAIDYIHLETDDYIPPGTNIRYYVGMDYDSNVIEWQEIEKNRPIEMRMVQDYHLDVDSYIEGYGDLLYTNFGQSFYRIARLPYKPLDKSIQLQMGRHMWLKESIPATVVTPENGVYQTSVRDWIRAPSSKREYMNTDNYQDVLTKDTFQRYTTYVYLGGAMNYDCKISVGEEASVALVLNNNRVKAVDHTYSLQFKAGWNKLEVLTYAHHEGQEILFSLYLREISDRIYADNVPLTQVSLYDLMNNTSGRIHNRFAVDGDNNVIVNYNPRENDVRRHGVEYTLTYNYSVSEMTRHQIRLMAILSKEDAETTITPRIKDYKLVIE